MAQIALGPILHATGTENPSANEIFQHYAVDIRGIDTVNNVANVVRASRSQQVVQNVEQVSLTFYAVDPTVLATKVIFLTGYSEKQTLSIDYSQWSNITRITDEMGLTVPSGPLIIKDARLLTIQLQGGYVYKSAVVPILIPYTLKHTKRPYVFDSDAPIFAFNTQKCYMVNGEFYLFGQGQNPSSVTEDPSNSSVMLTLTSDITSYAKYESGVWTIEDLRMKPTFKENYNYLVFFPTKHEIDLNTFGAKSLASNIEFFIVRDDTTLKSIKNGILKVDADGATPGAVVATFNVLAKVDVFELAMNITITYDRLNRINFYVPNDPNFPSNNNSSIKKSTYANKCIFGNFLFDNTDTCSAYNVTIGSDGSVDPMYSNKNLYPVVSFDADSMATVIVPNNGCQLTTGIIGTDDVIVNYNSFFNRLDHCSGLTVKQQAITISKNAGVNFLPCR